ncbi:MAG: ABC transporter ATP-binding protein [Candidatus Omnitrophota bacterium]|nr:ABC transporter ATP-binding protein [Candidatus Omnitrophota bacterium]MDD5654030.1 ABC transporter ATP-binding protein [Candidatus Omnitrophota bacterium]
MIEIEGVSKSFNGRKVLDNLDLAVNRGETKVIIGRSGCGKSVLLKHIVGLLYPDAGRVSVSGNDISLLSEKELNSVRMKIGMVFQGGALFDSLTVGENVGFGLIEHLCLEQKDVADRIKESLDLVELHGVEDLMPSELSGGMKKRVSLARALCIKPEVILYDEPTTGVDPITADSINSLIRGLHDRLGETSIVVTHDMKSAYKVADRIAMMYKGRIIAEGTPEEIQKLGDPVVHQFINGLASGPITEAVDDVK